MNLVSSVVGLTMVGGGSAKLLRLPAYETLVQGLSWTSEERRGIGAAELLGGALMLAGATRRLGAGVVLAASGLALSAELKGDRRELAAARAAVMLTSLLVLVTDSRPSPSHPFATALLVGPEASRLGSRAFE